MARLPRRSLCLLDTHTLTHALPGCHVAQSRSPCEPPPHPPCMSSPVRHRSITQGTGASHTTHQLRAASASALHVFTCETQEHHTRDWSITQDTGASQDTGAHKTQEHTRHRSTQDTGAHKTQEHTRHRSTQDTGAHETGASHKTQEHHDALVPCVLLCQEACAPVSRGMRLVCQHLSREGVVSGVRV